MNVGDYSKSIEVLQRALDIREEALGTGHPAVADILVNLIAAMRLGAEKLPLAQGWEQKEDAEGKSYWYNPGKLTVQYYRPLPDAFCDGSGGPTLKDLEMRLCSLESQSSMSANLSSGDVLLGLHVRSYAAYQTVDKSIESLALVQLSVRNYSFKVLSQRVHLGASCLSSVIERKTVVALSLKRPLLFPASPLLVTGEGKNLSILAFCKNHLHFPE